MRRLNQMSNPRRIFDCFSGRFETAEFNWFRRRIPNAVNSSNKFGTCEIRPVNTLRYDIRHCLYSCKLCFQFTTLRYWLYAPQVRSKQLIKGKGKKRERLRKNLLVGRFELASPELGRQRFSPLDYLHNLRCSKEVSIPSQWWLAVLKNDFFNFI